MLRTRKRWISLLVTLAMLVAFCLPAGTALADDSIFIVSKAVKQNVPDDNTATDLGWFKLALDAEDTVNGWVYVSVELPSGVVFADDEKSSRDFGGFAVTEGDPWSEQFNFTGDNQVKVKSSADDEIKVTVTARYIDNAGNSIDKYTGDILVGTKGDAEVTVTADSPKAVNVGKEKGIAKITLEENMAGALEEGALIVFTLEDDDFAWTSSLDGKIVEGDYDLAGVLHYGPELDEDEYDAQDLILEITRVSSPFESELELDELTITVYPGAPDGEIEVSVWDNSPDGVDSNIEDKTIVVAKKGDSEVTVTADEDTGDDIYVASLDNELYDITFESSSAFAEGDKFILTLPEGLEWAYEEGNTIDTTDDTDILEVIGLFDSKRGLWLELINDPEDSDEFTISGLLVNVAADAVPGDIELEVSGDFGEESVVVGKVLSRVNISAAKNNVTVGLDRTAGEITIEETGKDTLPAVGDIVYLTAPTGVTFAGKPTVKINGDEKGSVELVDDDAKVEITLEGLRTSRVDTIVISDIKLDLDSRVGYGDVLIKVGGTALNGLGDTEVNDTDGSDAVAKVAVATVVSPTAAKATMKIGDPTIVINGETKVMEAAPYIKNSRTYVSVTYAALACGVAPENIMWDGVNRTVTVIKGDRIAQFKIGSNVMTLNGAVITMDTAPEIVNARTMMPVTWVALALGGNTAWDAATQTVTVTVN